MTRRLGVVMDPIDAINPKKDSTLAMMLAAQRRGWQLFVIELSGLYSTGGHVQAIASEVTVDDDANHWFSLVREIDRKLTFFDAVLMRKPAFNMRIHLRDIPARDGGGRGCPVLNRPGSIRDCNEKLFTLRFPQCCPPHIVSRDATKLKGFHAEHGDVIYKPLDGMGGESIFRVGPDAANINVIIETLTAHGGRQIMAQRYLPEISRGDTRILLINGEPVPYGLARIPSAGETRGNLAAGGEGVGRELTERDYWICEQVGPSLTERGLYFTGIDVIGDNLTEINVTCPTCIRELDRAFDIDIAGQYMDFVETLMD
ncbi:MAG: glutathione synthase [Gammaproteobacteria bacterium]|nr:glutathione synthase [Gammaproteobacteria bacterium]